MEQGARQATTPLFTLVYNFLPERQSQPSRFAFIVSKRISKKAVERNRVRRQLVNSLLPQLDLLAPGLDGIFLAKAALLKAVPEVVHESLTKVLKEAGVLK